MTQAALDKDTMVAVTPEWHGPSEHPDHGEPVIAEFHEWDVPTNPAKEHTVWWYEGQWRTYPNTDDRAYVNRWRRIPTRHQSGRTGAGERETVARVIHQCLRPVNMTNADWDSGAILGANNSWRRSVYSTTDAILAALSQSTAGRMGRDG